jgi:hypothetical protein
MADSKKRVRMSENGIDLNLLAQLQTQTAIGKKSKYDGALQELGNLQAQLIGNDKDEKELVAHLDTLQKRLNKLEKLEKAMEGKKNAEPDDFHAQKRLEENFIYSLFLEQKLKKMRKAMKNKETRIERLKEQAKQNGITNPMQSTRKLPQSRLNEKHQTPGRPTDMNSSLLQNMYNSNPPEDKYPSNKFNPHHQFPPPNYNNGADFGLEAPLMNIRNLQPVAPLWDYDNGPMGNNGPGQNADYTPEQVEIINEMLMKNLAEKIQNENGTARRKPEEMAFQEKAINTLPLLQIQNVPGIIRYRPLNAHRNYQPHQTMTTFPPTLNLQLNGNSGWAVNMQPNMTDYPQRTFYQPAPPSSINRERPFPMTPLPPINERDTSKISDSQKGQRMQETPPLKQVPSQTSQKTNPNSNFPPVNPPKPPGKSRLAKILRKIFFVVFFSVAFKKSAIKLAQTRRQKIMSLYSEKETGVIEKFSKLVSKVFDMRFDEGVFEDNFDIWPTKIGDAEFLSGLDLMLKGFMDLNDSLAKPEAKDILIFLASTMIPGGIIIPDFLSLFVGRRIRVSDQQVFAYGQNSLMEGLMSVSVYIYAHIFLDRFVLIDYHDDKFIQIITQVIYHFLISFFAKVNPTLPPDERSNTMFIKYIHNWSGARASLRNAAPTPNGTPAPQKERSFYYSGDDSPIAGLPFDISHERFLNNKKVIDRLQTRLMPTLRKTYDLIIQGVKAIKQSILKAKMDRILKLKSTFPQDPFYKVAEEAIAAKTQKLTTN